MSHAAAAMPAKEALEKLKKGNASYLNAQTNPGDIGKGLREKTCKEGQAPYAIVITCSDSRVIPEAIFSAGIGEVFVIRVAGNVISDHQLGSVLYAVEHCGSRLVVVMGHDHCGAVGAAIAGGADGYVGSITSMIQKAIGGEKDDYKASCLNAKASAEIIKEKADLPSDVEVVTAVYKIETGEVDWL